MPELPEVETVRRGLLPHLLGQTIDKVEVFYTPVTHHLSGVELTAHFSGEKVDDIYRHGKFLILRIGPHLLIGHLRMEGKLLVGEEGKTLHGVTLQWPFPSTKHVHWVIRFQSGKILAYHDTRKFGRWHLYLNQSTFEGIAEFAKLGKEPINPLPSDYFYHQVHHRHQTLKQLLLDQSVLLGLGNIYADDTCFEAGIYPFKSGHKLTKKQCSRIEVAAKNVLERAILAGGTTIRTYVAADYLDGLFPNPTKVYGREGEPCDVCGTPITKSMRIGRSTHWCPTCQKL